MNSVGMPTGQSDVVMVRWLNRLGRSIRSTLRNASSEGTRGQKAKLAQAVEHRGTSVGEAGVGTQTGAGAREGKPAQYCMEPEVLFQQLLYHYRVSKRDGISVR